MLRLVLSCILGVFLCSASSSQGKLILNEYCPWPATACGPTAEFIELYNIGPGPVNIGCYIVSTHKYSITIPPGTIILPGQFYVLGGQNIIPAGCGNAAKDITVNLNWYTCGCTNVVVPSTGDALMTDGGFGNTPVVLMSNIGTTVIDAVVRDLPAESSFVPVTAYTFSGACPTRTYNLSFLGITYETIGQSAGRNNSFSRLNDGDCGWDKTPPMSGGAPNSNTGSHTLDVTYSINYPSCPSNGNVLFNFTAGNGYTLSSLFPMNYTLAFDANGNGTFDITDTYTNGTIASPGSLLLNLPPGNYSIGFYPATGCGDRNIPFIVTDCLLVLPVKLIEFAGRTDGVNDHISWKTDHCESVDHFELMSSYDGINFSKIATIAPVTGANGIQSFRYTSNRPAAGNGIYYRLTSIGKDHVAAYSNIIFLEPPRYDHLFIQSLFPNPVVGYLQLLLYSTRNSRVNIRLCDITGKNVFNKQSAVNKGINNLSLDLSALPQGMYHIEVTDQQDHTKLISRVLKN